MSNPSTYLKFHDAYRDTGDFGGDIHRAMDEIGNELDEHGVTVTKNGKVWAEKMPEVALRALEHRIYAEREVQVFAEGVSGANNPTPVGTVMRTVPVKCVPVPVLMPGEEPKSDSAFDRALVTAKQSVTRSNRKGDICSFSGTLSMLWFAIKADAKRRKMDLDINQLDDTLRMIQKAIPEAAQASYPLFQHFIGRIVGSESFHDAMDCLQADFTVAATEMHKMRDFKNDREVQLDSVAYAMGVRPDQLISCDLEGNVIGGQGAFLTNQGRWTDDDDNDGQNGELYADRHSPKEMDNALEEQVRIDAFNRVNTGAGNPDHQLIFDPKYLLKKPLDREFWVDVPTYTLFFWPKGQDPTEDNLKVVNVAGFWSDVKRAVINSEYDKSKWSMDVERGEKTSISTSEPMYRKASWHLGCVDPKCDGRRYCFWGDASDELTELAAIAAKPDEWDYDEDKKMAEYKRETEEMLGMPLIDFLNDNARDETCPECHGPLMYVNPQQTIKTRGETIRIPKMTICRDNGWWNKPLVMDDFDQLLKIYGGDKRKASERMGTISSYDGIKYAEQIGDTTYTWALDWLQQPEQVEVRNLRDMIPNQNLNNHEMFVQIRQGITKNFTKKQRRFLIDQLYSQRAVQQWEQVEESEFVDALRRKLSHVTMETFHDAYSLVARILMTNTKLTFAEKNYGWALLNGLKAEFQLQAETTLLHGKGCEHYDKWILGLKLVSFRHLNVVYERCNMLKAQPESIFLIKEAVKVARRRLAALARTTSWIEAQENYLYSVEAGDVNANQERIDDIVAGSRLAKSAGHLVDRVKEVLSA